MCISVLYSYGVSIVFRVRGLTRVHELPLLLCIGFDDFADAVEEPQHARHLQAVINLEAPLVVQDDSGGFEHR